MHMGCLYILFYVKYVTLSGSNRETFRRSCFGKLDSGDMFAEVVEIAI